MKAAADITCLCLSLFQNESLEMGISLGWERFVGPKGKVLAIDTFGASGTGADVMKLFGFYRRKRSGTSKRIAKGLNKKMKR